MFDAFYRPFLRGVLSIFALFCFSILPSEAQTEALSSHQTSFSTIMDNIRIDIRKQTDSAKSRREALQWLSLVNKNGSFDDILYNDKSRTNWAPILHLERLKVIALAFTMTENELYNDKVTYNSIINMLNFWYNANPQSDNWWMQRIAVPKQLGLILIILRSSPTPLPADLEINVLNRMEKLGGSPDKIGTSNTGANKLDIATHWIYRGCLTENLVVLEKGIEQAFFPLHLTTKEGFQHDFSYHQHGPQLYIGGYGKVILYGTIDIANYLIGTPYALSKEKLDLLYNYLYHSYLPCIRGTYSLYNTIGRSLARYDGLNQSDLAIKLSEIASLDSTRKEFYETAIKRITGKETSDYGIHPFHSHFWRSDYTLHQRSHYTTDVRMASFRTYKSETVNQENLKGYFLTDGAMDIAVSGGEYIDIFPVWDWSRIPGTTTPVLPIELIPPLEPTASKRFGKSRFAGGVSNGIFGISAYHMIESQYKEVNIEAKKSWFFFDNEIVCLGADIKSKNSAFRVNTTLNQCLLSDSVSIILNNTSDSILTPGRHSFFNDLSWVVHQHIGYYFPNKGNVQIQNEKRDGNWSLITLADKETSKNVFTLCLDHGITPDNDNYSYFIIPGIHNISKAALYPVENIEIILNTNMIQAVWHKDLDIVGIVFYKPSSLIHDSMQIAVSKPCILLVDGIHKDEFHVYVADPTGLAKRTDIKIRLPGMESGIKIESFFPREKALRGSTVKYTIIKTP